MLFRSIEKGIALPFASATSNQRDLVSIETIIDLIMTCIVHPRAPGEVFLVSDGKAISTREIIEDVARRDNLNLKLFPVPLIFISALLKSIGRNAMEIQLFGNLEIDISKTKEKLQWTPQNLAAVRGTSIPAT